MKKITFKNIYIEGFGSIVKPLQFNLDQKGVTIIIGKNGAGKSTVFNALFWVLYGTLLKNVTNPSIPTKKAYRGKNFIGTRVIVDVKVGKDLYSIARHINYKGTTFGVTGGSSVVIEKNRKILDISSADKKDYNTFINELIGLDKDSFLNAILFGQKMKRLLDTSDAARRTVFEGMVDLSFLDEALERCKADLTASQEVLLKYKVELESCTRRKADLNNQIKDYKQELKELKKDRKKNYNSIKQEIEKYKAKIKCSSLEDKEIEKLSKQFDKNRKVLDNFRAVAKEKEKQYYKDEADLKVEKYRYKITNDELLDSGAKVCSKCGSKLNPAAVLSVKRDVENRIKASNKKIKKLQNSIRLYNIEQEKSTEEFITLNTDNEQLRQKINVKRKEHTSKDTYDGVIQDLKERLEAIDKSKEEQLKAKVDKYTKKYKNLEIEYQDIEQEIQKLEKKVQLLTWWAKKGFNNTGLKQFMFLSFLSKLNVATVKYTAPLGFFVDFSIDTSKATKPFTTKCYFADGVEYTYNEYSGGEAVKVSVASMLGINDVICNDVDINIMLFDEVFESLDEAGKESVFELLNMKQGKSIFVVTHIPNIDLLNCKKVEVIKKKHNTYFK